MFHWLSTHLSYFLTRYGYWTVLVGLLVENSGIPVPGETILISASVLARTTHQLNILYVAAVAITAATIGDNLGFALGRYAGCPLLLRYRELFHIEEKTIRRGEELFRRRGNVAVFFARFIAGLRVLAGPMAGILKMPWREFALYNALGAIAWVGVVASASYFLGPAIESLFRHASLATAIILALVLIYRWFTRKQRQTRQ